MPPSLLKRLTKATEFGEGLAFLEWKKNQHSSETRLLAEILAVLLRFTGADKTATAEKVLPKYVREKPVKRSKRKRKNTPDKATIAKMEASKAHWSAFFEARKVALKNGRART